MIKLLSVKKNQLSQSKDYFIIIKLSLLKQGEKF